MEPFQHLLESLHRERVQLIIVGGLAAVLHGASFITDDLDICYQRKKGNYAALVRALAPFKPELRGPHNTGIPFPFDEKMIENGLNFTLKTTAGDIDILGELQFAGRYEDLLPASVKTELYGMEFKIISLDHLIQIKRKLRRKKDLVHLDILEALQKMKGRAIYEKENKIHQ